MNKKKIITIALSGIIGLGSIGATSIHAKGTEANGETQVTYSTENIINPNGKWMAVVPASINLHDTAKTKDIEIELRAGENQGEVGGFHADFEVTVKASSGNGFNLTEDVKKVVPYKMIFDGATWDGTGDANKEVILNGSQPKLGGKIETNGTTVPGKYTDKITFEFTPSANDPFTNK